MFAVVAGLVALTTASALLRVEGIGVSLWLDEGISIGIASHRLTEIPGLLAQDGSPPLYYLLLHAWMAAFGDGAVALRSLSLVFALATVPVAYLTVASLFGRRAGWIAAVLAATSPYVGTYAREARMYSLLALLVLVGVASFVHAFAFGHRRWLPAFVVSTALVLYTHNWGLFFAAGAGLAVLPCLLARPDRRRVLHDATLAFGTVAVLYAPWLPTLARQIEQTGAPWSPVPTPRDALLVVSSVLGDQRVLVALAVSAAVPLLRLSRRWSTGEGRSALAITTMYVSSLAMAWTASQLEPGWSLRYFGIFLAPLLVLAALGLSRAGGAGVVAVVLVVGIWTQPLARLSGTRCHPTTTRRARGTGNVDEQRYVAEHVVEDLAVHAVIEEEILYPAMRDALPDGDGLVEEALQEHQEAKELLTRIDGKDPQSEDARNAFDELVSTIHHHVQEEEGELLPRLRGALGQERLREMGQALDKARKAAPTHPHPHAPNTPPGNVAAGAFATVVDKIRDAFRS